METNSHKVTVLSYGDNLVIVARDPHKDIDKGLWVPTGKGRIGCVLCDANPSTLAVSEGALNLMSRIPRGTDAIGDIDWWKTIHLDNTPRGHAFSWFGPISRIIDVREAQSARGFMSYRDGCTIVPNEMEPRIEKLVSDAVTKGASMWDPDTVTHDYSDSELRNLNSLE